MGMMLTFIIDIPIWFLRYVFLQAILPNNNVVAVKQLFLKTHEVINSFINEVVLITNLQHRNLVNLKGFCVSGKEMLLVYEYVDNHDLDKILLSKLNSSISHLLYMFKPMKMRKLGI